MNAISKSALAMALLAAVSACGQEGQDNGAAAVENTELVTDNAVVVNEVTPPLETNTVEQTTTASPPAATKIAPMPLKDPSKPKPPVKAPPPHDMGNMSDAEMKNMSH